jgi:hypothetical protein
MILKHISLAAVLTFSASLAHATQPVATLLCVGNGANISLNLSYYDVGATIVPRDTHEWDGGTGSPQQSFTLNAALGSFQTLFQTEAAGTVMSTCTLSTVASNGDSVQFIMKSVRIKSVSAMSSAASVAAPATSFVNAVLGFATMSVVDTGGGTDDGGASPIGGFDLGTNKKV